MDELIEDFWYKWVKADEIERRKMLELTPLPNKHITLVNSYLVDLYEYMLSHKN